MKTLKGCVGFGALVVAVTAMPSIAEVNTSVSTMAKQTSSEVHRVGSVLASKESYRSSQSGYKWGKTENAPSQSSNWVADSTNMPSYKWSQQQEGISKSGDYAGSAGYDWKTMGQPAQSGYRWRAQSTPEVAGYRWRAQNTPEVVGYRWRAQNTPEVAGYRWRAQNTPEVAGYRWRAQSTPEVAGYRWRAQ